MGYQQSRLAQRARIAGHGQAFGSVFRYAGLYELRNVLPVEPEDDHTHAPLLLFLIAVSVNVTGSAHSLLIALDDPGLWPELMSLYGKYAKTDVVPTRPPTERILGRWLAETSSDDALMERIRQGLMWISMGEALRQGYLLPEAGAPDRACPSPKNFITGDGSYLGPYSKVKLIRDGDGTRRVVDSRARNPQNARIQKRVTQGDKEHPNALGINNVIFVVPTVSGALWLTADQAFGSEARKAMTLVKELHELNPRGIHTLLYDKAITGHLSEHLLSRGLYIITRPLSRGRNKLAADWRQKIAELTADEARDRFRTSHTITISGHLEPTFPLNEHGLLDVTRLVPLGMTVYPTNRADDDSSGTAANDGVRMTRRRARKDADVRDGLEVVRTHFQSIRTEWLRGYTGPDHYAFFVDGDALVATVPGKDGKIYKVATAQAQAAKTVTGRDGCQEWHITWELSLPEGMQLFRTVSSPNAARRDAKPQPGTADANVAFSTLRPLARSHGAAWTVIGNQRNVSESENSVWKRCYPAGRARRLDVQVQRLELFATWAWRVADVHRVWKAQNYG